MTVIYVCKMIISSGVFSIFLKSLIFWVHRGVKGQKTVQNDKTLCLLHSISQDPYIIWLLFMVQMCKVVICSFSRFSRGWIGKNGPKMSKISVCCTICFRNHISYDLHLWYTCMYKRIISPGIFFFFSKFWYLGLLGGGKMAKNGPKLEIFFVCLTPYLRNRTSYDCDF